MHVFFESVWKLHIGEIPEKPLLDVDDYNQLSIKGYNLAVEKYNEKIAIIKQNALTVGNPEFLESHFWCGKFEHLNLIEIPPPPDKFYFWPGGYETKEIKDGEIRITAGGHPFLGSKTVAVLTLPEEKKNTMENMTKEQNYKCLKCGVGTPYEVYHTFFGLCNDCVRVELASTTASGSVAAPKVEELCPTCGSAWGDVNGRYCSNSWHLAAPVIQNQIAFLYQQLKEREEALKELLSLAVRYKNTVNFTTREDEFDRTQAIIERARKLLSK